MGYFENSKNVTLKDLRSSGIYDETIIKCLENGDFKVLAQLDIEQQSGKDFMEPILYALKNEYDTYIAYKYYSASLQNDIELAREIIKAEPELIENTVFCNDRQFIQDVVETSPNVIKYMSQELKKDTKFITELYETKNLEALVKDSEALSSLLTDKKFCNDKTFMNIAIEQDVNTLKFASEELKNNYEFLKEQSSKNEKVIDYVVHNTKELGEEGLKATKEVVLNKSVEQATADFEEAKTVQGLDEKEMARLERHIKFMEKIKDDPLKQEKLAKYFKMLQEAHERDPENNRAPNLNEHYMKRLEQYGLIDGAIVDRQTENLQEETESINPEQFAEDKDITPLDVEEATPDRSITDINAETIVVREELAQKQQDGKEEEVK